MGRAMLIIVIGLMISMGYTYMGMSGQKSTMISQNVNSANKAMAKNMAHTGIQLAINEFSENSSWEKHQTKSETIDGTTIEYSWEEGADPDLIRIIATATTNNTTDEIVATIEKGETIDLTKIPGAMGVFGDESQVTINGNPPSIDGRDHDIDATAPNGNSDDYKAGAAGVSSFGDTFDINKNHEDDLLTGDPEYQEDSDLDGQFLEDDVENKYLPNSEPYDGSNLGTLGHPSILTVEGDQTVDSNGAGILIVKPGAKLEIKGNNKYHGLIIVQGTLELKGTPQVYGSILFTDNSSVDVDDADGDVEDPDGTYAGTPDIRYSSEALDNLNENLNTSGGSGGIVSIYE